MRSNGQNMILSIKRISIYVSQRTSRH